MAIVVCAAGQLKTYSGPETAFNLRIYNRITFLNSSGVPVLGEDSGSTDDYIEVACTVASDIISHASFNIDSTTDALTAPPDDDEDTYYHYRFDLYTTDGEYHSTIFKRIQVPALPNPTTMAALVAFSNPPVTITLSLLAQIYAFIANLLANLTKATIATYGVVRMNTAPADPLDPVAVGPNDPLVTGGAAGNETDTYRSNPAFATLADAITAASGNVLAFTAEQPITVDTELPNSVRTRLGGLGKFNVSSAMTLTIEAPSNTDERKWNIGPGKMVHKNTSAIRMANWAGPFGGTTTLNGGINTSIATLTVTDASVFGPAPLYIAIDKEVIYCPTDAVANVFSGVTRTFEGTNASHSNEATIYTAVTSAMRDGMITSLTVMGGGRLIIGPGTWATVGGWDFPNGTVVEGSGGIPDAILGTNLLLIADNTYPVKVGNLTRNVKVNDITLDVTGTTGSECFEISGPNGGSIFHPRFTNCSFKGGSYTRLRDTATNGMLVIGAVFDHCYWIGQTEFCFQSLNTPNTSVQFIVPSFTPAPNGVSIGLDFNYSGPIVIGLPTFNGVNVNPGSIHTTISAIDTARTTANEDIDNAEIAIDVVDGTVFGAAPFVIVIDSEEMNVTSIAVNTFTVTRAYNSTTAVVHSNGASVKRATHGLMTVTGHSIPLFKNVSTTAAEDIDISETAIDVTSAVVFGAAPYDILIDDEVIHVTSVATNTVTGVRGWNNTTAATHSNGVTVNMLTPGLEPITIFNSAPGNLPPGYTDKELLYFKAINKDQGYAYRAPKDSFLATEGLRRKDFTGAGTGTNIMKTTVPISAGRPYACMRVQNTHSGIDVTGWQDEGIGISVIVDNTYEAQRGINFHTSSFQGIFQLNSLCLLNFDTCWMLGRSVKDYSSSISTSSAKVFSKACTVYNPTGSAFIDAGGTTMGAVPTLSGFVGNSVFYIAENHEYGVNLSEAPQKIALNHPWGLYYGPIQELVRDRSVPNAALAKEGLKEAWEDTASRYYERYHLDSKDGEVVLPYPWMDQFLEFRPDLAKTAEQGGVSIFGHVGIRGRFINNIQTELVSAANVTPLNCAASQDYYFLSLAEDTTINASNIIASEDKIIYIPATTTSRTVVFGTGFGSGGTHAFNTGSIAGTWIIRFRSLGGTLYQIDQPYLTGSGTNIPEYSSLNHRGTSGTGPHDLVVGEIKWATGSSLVTFPLPAKGKAGDRCGVRGVSSANWKVTQAAGQTIVVRSPGTAGIDQTTTGTSGFLQSCDPNAEVIFVCTDDDITWRVETDNSLPYAVDGVHIAGAGSPRNQKSAAYTTVMSDIGRTICHPTADNNARTFTIDSNANVPYPIGTRIRFQNEINTVSIAITTDTMTLQGAGGTGTRTLAADGWAEAYKMDTTKWAIYGFGLT